MASSLFSLYASLAVGFYFFLACYDYYLTDFRSSNGGDGVWVKVYNV